MSSFNPIKAVQRFFTIRPQSFTPANIVRSVTAGTVGVLTLGVGIPVEVGGEKIASTSAHESAVINSAVAGANSFGTVRVGDPKQAESKLDMFGRVGGGAVTAIASGSAISSALSTPSYAALPSGVEGPVQSLSYGEQFGNFGAVVVSHSASGYATSTIGQTIVGTFGKIGAAFLQLLSGNLLASIQTFTKDEPTKPVGVFQGGGGGGGGGFFPGGNTGQSTINPLLFPVMGIAAIGVVILIARRK